MAAGITGVWVTSTTRDAIWDGMKRKETYVSSGPRITIRFFGGYDLPANVGAGDIAATGYTKGVPMGGDLKPPLPARRRPSWSRRKRTPMAPTSTASRSSRAGSMPRA